MAQNRNYEDFQPAHDWGRDEQSDTLILHLPGSYIFCTLTIINILVN